jgi:hypothetical protein
MIKSAAAILGGIGVSGGRYAQPSSAPISRLCALPSTRLNMYLVIATLLSKVDNSHQIDRSRFVLRDFRASEVILVFVFSKALCYPPDS